jgi:acetolactate synthase-1/2/3 large subunit
MLPTAGIPIIQIDIDPVELGRNYPNTCGLLGDAKITVRRLMEFLSPRPSKNKWAERAYQLKREWQLEIEPLCNSNAKPILPERLCMELTNLLPSDTVLVSDTGHAGMWTGAMHYPMHPGQSYLRAAGSLGWAFPAALGAKCAVPDRHVVCFTGDGGFWYHLSELETARRCGIKTLTIVNNNSSLNQTIKGVDRAYGDNEGKREEMYKFSDVSFARIAEEMGCLGIRVEDPEKISESLKMALDADVPVVLDVVTDIKSRAPGPWVPSK